MQVATLPAKPARSLGTAAALKDLCWRRSMGRMGLTAGGSPLLEREVELDAIANALAAASAGMAAQGMTNRQIAEALFVTVKTVGWHLGNAYRKLGVGTREELAARFSSEDAETGSKH